MGSIKIPQPEKFSGKTGTWDEWHLLIKSFVATVNPRYKELMDWAEQQTEEITDKDVCDYEELTTDENNDPIIKADTLPTTLQLTRNLHHILTGFTESPGPRTLVMQILTCNGFEAWRRLYVRYAIPTKAKAAGSLSVLLRKKFPEDDFESHFDAWEHEIAKYERDTKTFVSDDVKIGIVMGGTTGPLNEYLTLQSSTFVTFAALKNVCVNYHKNRSAFKAASANNAQQQDLGVHAMKGKGKGKGKNFNNYGGKGGKGKGKGNSQHRSYSQGKG